MCGIVGHVSSSPVNQQIYDSLLLLQHRGQDSTGIATAAGDTFHTVKRSGQVREAYRTRDMRTLIGNVGIGHVRYATSGASTEDEVQPFYVNAPYGILLVHNGNLTNTRELTDELFRVDRRHLNSSSDTELLLNVLANELQQSISGADLTTDVIFDAVANLHKRVEGSYAALAIIAGHGLLAFRDPFGIRPLVLGRRMGEDGRDEWVVASESLVLTAFGYDVEREVAPGEAIFIDTTGKMTSRQCATETRLAPCSFEYVYLARPDSVMNGISVYDTRLNMGEKLARKVEREMDISEIDVVMPIPDSARPSAMQLAHTLDLPYREGFYKNRYVGRTFIMPGQEVRKKSVRQKLNALEREFEGKNVLLVDDSIVRGTTSKQIIDMARAAGAKKVFFASAAPAVRYPHVYGINMPTRAELVASSRTTEEVCKVIGADKLIFQDVDDLFDAITVGTDLTELDMSPFTGEYVTGTVSDEYLAYLEANRIS
ncbi:amidophosphoribosyltransferase [Gulosibacter chungangensis]|uniref:Amidophosphoribosyltransferase n=1 Tax=Gulosibacter chungangensis TaxID=979746 RepID=A0A7J5B9K0_9MICO|nr:amidophosphoribosyltransferase [Gulosibacter chungangensis]KAB1642212.1 amidophosphoribosyltransferase [Gulosibacter chungangensis]